MVMQGTWRQRIKPMTSQLSLANRQRLKWAILQRQVKRLPLLQTARQRCDVETGLLELQRHTGAGGFIGSRAEQHQRPVLRKFLNFFIEPVQRHPDGVGNGVGIGVEFHPLSQVSYLQRFASLQPRVKVRGLNAATP